MGIITDCIDTLFAIRGVKGDQSMGADQEVRGIVKFENVFIGNTMQFAALNFAISLMALFVQVIMQFRLQPQFPLAATIAFHIPTEFDIARYFFGQCTSPQT